MTVRADIFSFLLTAALAVAACSDDDTAAASRQNGVILFGGSADKGISWHNGRTTSRAGGDEVAATTPDNIGVFAFGDGQNTTYIFRNQKAYCQTGREFNAKFDWRYTSTSIWSYTTDMAEEASVQVPWEEMRYRFFAYSPWYETQDVKVSAENYSGFNSFTWNNVPGFSDKDFVLANEIIDVDNTDGHCTTAGSVVHFRMRHILSRIRFFFKMSEAYRKLRKIELNSLTVLTAGKVKTATFNFRNDAWDETVNWSNEQMGTAEPVELTNQDALHYFLPTTYPAEPFADVYVYPQENFNALKMKLKYTVYDAKDAITRTAEITNNVEIKPAWTLLSGYYYDIYINVVPDYLYVLSDNDQDFDGWVIIKE